MTSKNVTKDKDAHPTPFSKSSVKKFRSTSPRPPTIIPPKDMSATENLPAVLSVLDLLTEEELVQLRSCPET
jgi:hypothetical protein